jgi:O-antigen/teichoic acid export membrane protein
MVERPGLLIMSNNRKILANIFSLSIAEFASKGLQAVFYIYLARVLGKEGLGSIGFAQSFTAYFILFVKVGFDTVGTRAVAQNPDRIKSIVNSIISIRTLLAFSVFAMLILTIFFVMDYVSIEKFSINDKLIIVIAGLNIFSFAYLLNWVYIGLERMKIIAIRTVIIGFTNIAGILIFVTERDDALIAISIMVFSNLLTSLYLYMYYRKEFGGFKWEYNKEQWNTLTKASVSIGLTFLIITIYNNLDVTMLRFIKGKAETGIYEAAHRILLLTVIIAGIIQNAFFPQVSRLKGAELTQILKRFSGLLYITGIALAFFFFVFADYLTILINDSFADSVTVLRIMSVTIILMFVNISFFSPLVAWGYEKNIFYGNLIGLGFNVTLNALLIPEYGASGAAVATISTEIGVILYISYLYLKVRKDINYSAMLKSFVVAILSFGPGIYFVRNDYNPVLSLVICIILFVVFTFAFRIISINEIKVIIKR